MILVGDPAQAMEFHSLLKECKVWCVTCITSQAYKVSSYNGFYSFLILTINIYLQLNW